MNPRLLPFLSFYLFLFASSSEQFRVKHRSPLELLEHPMEPTSKIAAGNIGTTGGASTSRTPSSSHIPAADLTSTKKSASVSPGTRDSTAQPSHPLTIVHSESSGIPSSVMPPNNSPHSLESILDGNSLPTAPPRDAPDATKSSTKETSSIHPSSTQILASTKTSALNTGSSLHSFSNKAPVSTRTRIPDNKLSSLTSNNRASVATSALTSDRSSPSPTSRGQGIVSTRTTTPSRGSSSSISSGQASVATNTLAPHESSTSSSSIPKTSMSFNAPLTSVQTPIVSPTITSRSSSSNGVLPPIIVPQPTTGPNPGHKTNGGNRAKGGDRTKGGNKTKGEDKTKGQKMTGPAGNPTPTPSPGVTTAADASAPKATASCRTRTASSCAISCTTNAGQSTASCTTKCETSTGCLVTDVASTTTKSCSPGNRATLGGGPEDSYDRDEGDQGPDSTYTGSVPAWVTAWPSSSSATPTPTPTPLAAKAKCVMVSENISGLVFKIQNIENWSEDSGIKLRQELGECGELKDFEQTQSQDGNEGLIANARLGQPWKMGCIEHAVELAGGPDLECKRE